MINYTDDHHHKSVRVSINLELELHKRTAEPRGLRQGDLRANRRFEVQVAPVAVSTNSALVASRDQPHLRRGAPSAVAEPRVGRPRGHLVFVAQLAALRLHSDNSAQKKGKSLAFDCIHRLPCGPLQIPHANTNTTRAKFACPWLTARSYARKVCCTGQLVPGRPPSPSGRHQLVQLAQLELEAHDSNCLL